jgi:uncharacterized sulfatase
MGCSQNDTEIDERPNFLLVISDDQSWEHTSFIDYPLVATPNFDRIAREGIYFENSYAAAPTCTASRSAILAGQPIWRLGSSSMLAGNYSEQMISFQNLLEQEGYYTGYTGKGWAPGKVPKERGLELMPTGRKFRNATVNRGSHLGEDDLAGNFQLFLDSLPEGRPFSFWAGAIEPHRPYQAGVNRFDSAEAAKLLPGFLPNTPRIQSEVSSYLDEVEIFDADLGELLKVLDSRGLLNNTVIIVTSDNGMPFPRAKNSNYVHGVRVPLAVRWGASIKDPGRTVKDFINLADLAPTILDIADTTIPESMTANSFKYALLSHRSGFIDPACNKTFSAFQRHSRYARGGESNLTYPRRAVHTENFVYIRNYFPERWPAGDPPSYVESYSFLLKTPNKKPIEPYYSLATQKRPRVELYDLRTDPNQLVNVAGVEAYADVADELGSILTKELLATGDPLETTGEDVFQEYE